MFSKRLLQLVPKARLLIVADVLLQWIALLATIIVFAFVGNYLDAIFSVSVTEELTTQFIGAVVISCIVFFAATAGAHYLGLKAAADGKRVVRQTVFNKLVRLGSSYKETVSTSQAVQICGEGVQQLESYFGQYLPQLFYAVLAPVSLLVFTLTLSVPTAIILFVCVPLIPIAIVAVMKIAKRVMGAYWDSYIDLGANFLEAVQGLTSLKVFRADQLKQEEMNEQAEGFRKATMRLLRVQLSSVTIMDFFTFGGAALGIIIALFQYQAGALTLGGTFTIIMLATQFFLPMRILGSYFHTAMGAATVIDQVFEVLDAKEPDWGSLEVNDEEVSVELDNLSYSYDGETNVLENVSFYVDAVSFLGITGESGSGKSTLAGILTGANRNYSGSVKLAGIELKDIKPESLHKTVTCVSANSHVFKGSFRSNLALGDNDATDYQMWNALQRCNLDDFVLEMGGLDAPITENGGNLSGGQRQRLCVARAFLRNTPVYIFDEATSNIDADSEAAIIGFIQELTLYKTVIVVSHRLGAIKWSDSIAVFDKGHLIEMADHSSLVAHGGAYANLWNHQKVLESYASSLQHYKATDATFSSNSGITIPDAMSDALDKMPEKIATIALQSVKTARIRNLTETGGSGIPLGHPDDIPIGGMSKSAKRREAILTSEVAPAEVNSEENENRIIEVAGELENSPIMNLISPDDYTGDNAEANTEAEADAAQVNEAEADATAEQTLSAADILAEEQDLDVVVEVEQEEFVDESKVERSAPKTVIGLIKLAKQLFPMVIQATCLGGLGYLCAVGIALFAVFGLMGLYSSAISLPLITAIILTAVCGIARGVLRYGERLVSHDETFKTLALIRNHVFEHMRTLAPAKLESRSSGDLIALLTSDIELLEVFYAHTMSPVIVEILVCLVMVIFMGCLSPVMALVAAVFYLIVGVIIPLVSARLLDKQGQTLREATIRMTSYMLESLNGLQELLQFGRGDEQSENLDARMATFVEFEDNMSKRSVLSNAFANTFVLAAPAVAALIGVSLVSAGSCSAAAIALCTVPFALSFDAPLAVASLGFSLHQVLAAGKRVLDFLQEKPETPEIFDGVEITDFQGARAENASFSYGEEEVFKNVSLSVEPGQVVHIAGRSGAGKSTLLKLFLRFWDAKSGVISVSNENVSAITTQNLRSVEGYMTQDTHLFSGSIRDNIMFVAPQATEEELASAIKKASLESLIERLPQGLDTQLGEVGEGLSSGERQRIGLARMFLYDAPFLLLDEPTSNLDAINEAAILQSLENNHGDKTVFIVSHRPSVAAIADVAYSIEYGRLC